MKYVVFFFLFLFAPVLFAQQQDTSQQAKARYEQAMRLFDKKQYLQAAEAFEDANRIYPDASFLFNAATSYFKCETYDTDQKALSLLQEFIRLYPSAPTEKINDAKLKLGEIMVRNPPKKPEPILLPATIPASCPVVEVTPPKSEPPKFCEQRKGLCYAAIGFVSVSVASSVYVGYRYSIPNADGHFVGKR